MFLDTSDLMSMRYEQKSAPLQNRMEAHDIMEESMKVWSTKLESKGLSMTDPAAKREAEFKL